MKNPFFLIILPYFTTHIYYFLLFDSDEFTISRPNSILAVRIDLPDVKLFRGNPQRSEDHDSTEGIRGSVDTVHPSIFGVRCVHRIYAGCRLATVCEVGTHSTFFHRLAIRAVLQNRPGRRCCMHSGDGSVVSTLHTAFSVDFEDTEYDILSLSDIRIR